MCYDRNMRNTLIRLMATLALLVGLSAAPAQAAGGSGSVYGWSWKQPVVYVYDGTGNSQNWRVFEAAAEWSRPSDSLNLKMTTNQSIADIVVTETDGLPYAGLARWSVSGNTAYYCIVQLNPVFEFTAMNQHTVIHEMGHCLGIDHNRSYVRGSVMNTYVNSSDAVKSPSSFDYRTLKKIY
jgi:predicted Zn-dependent protease